MIFAPMLTASLAIQLHAAAAIAAFVLGGIQLAARKGTPGHRTMGWIWVVLMLGVALSSFAIREVNGPDAYSWIHLLSVLTLVLLPLGVHAARTGRISRHGRVMTGLFVGGLVIAGAFTFAPGRILHRVMFGG